MIHIPFVRNCILLVLLSFMACNKNLGKKQISTSTKPNIIYIMADDLTTQAISLYGDIYKDIAPTPNIDRIGKEGMTFHNVLCTNAICGPSRAAILTGNYSHINKFYKNENGGQFDNTQWTFPQEFQDQGYQTALFGKWHLGSEPKGFDVFKYHNASAQQGLYWDPVYNVNGKDQKFKGYATNLTTGFALDWLNNECKTDQPFLLVLQYKAPHRPWEPDTKYEKLWDDIEIPYPSTFNDNYKGREKTAGDTEMTMQHLSRRDLKQEIPAGLTGKEKLKWEFYGQKNDEIVQPDGMTAEEGKKWRYQIYIKDYLACVKSVDDNIGKVLDYLKAHNLEENTVIVLTSDQGFYLGDHGFYDKRFIYEESLRMPFLMKYPKLIKPGSQNKDIISNIDFAPTLLELAGLKTKQSMQGKSFVKLLKGQKNSQWRQSMYYHYYEFPFWHHVQPHYGIRTERYTLAHFYYNVDIWELYDNKKDPDQIHNIINDPAYAEVIKDLKAQLSDLKKTYHNDKSLDEYRKISDTNFGLIGGQNKSEYNVQDIINNNK